jgi:hypothetical protein
VRLAAKVAQAVHFTFQQDSGKNFRNADCSIRYIKKRCEYWRAEGRRKRQTTYRIIPFRQISGKGQFLK